MGKGEPKSNGRLIWEQVDLSLKGGGGGVLFEKKCTFFTIRKTFSMELLAQGGGGHWLGTEAAEPGGALGARAPPPPLFSPEYEVPYQHWGTC